MKTWSRISQGVQEWGRDLLWGGLLYLLAMVALFFILAHGEASFIYMAF